MENLLAIIHKSLFTGLVFLFSLQSVVLFLRSKGNKVRKTLASVLLLWVAVYLVSLVKLYVGGPQNTDAIFRVSVLVFGNYYISITFLFPLQVLIPGWLNWKHALLLFLPILLCSAVYFAGMSLLGETPEYLTSYGQLFSSIGHFNVWFRFVILLTNFAYVFWIVQWLIGYEKRYILWKNDNFSDQDYVDISWMKAFNYQMLLISVFYLIVLVFGGTVSILLHTVVVLLSFSYMFYKGLFYESPYPENFFSEANRGNIENCEVVVPVLSVEEKIGDISEQSFERRIPTYVTQIKTWLEEEKPYLYHDFKLTDVYRVLPLNRSYLSRVFNDGFGQNFSEVVRYYRVEYSKEIMRNNSALPLHKVAELCGFLSGSSFVRAFKQVTDITPKQFRNEHK